VCIGNSETSLQSYSFVPSTTITPGYCMLGWSAQTGVAISNTADINPTFTVSTLGTFTINLMVSNANRITNVVQSITTNTCLDVAISVLHKPIGSISLFPNPTENNVSLTVKSQNETVLTLSIYAMVGNEVARPIEHAKLV